jgi:hypothetical protein
MVAFLATLFAWQEGVSVSLVIKAKHQFVLLVMFVLASFRGAVGKEQAHVANTANEWSSVQLKQSLLFRLPNIRGNEGPGGFGLEVSSEFPFVTIHRSVAGLAPISTDVAVFSRSEQVSLRLGQGDSLFYAVPLPNGLEGQALFGLASEELPLPVCILDCGTGSSGGCACCGCSTTSGTGC